MKKKKNRLSNIIKWELICLAAVTVFVAGLIKWSEGRAGASGEDGAGRAVSGAVKAGENDGKDPAKEDGTGLPAEGNPGGGTPAVTGIASVPTMFSEEEPAPTAEVQNPMTVTPDVEMPGASTSLPSPTAASTSAPTARPTEAAPTPTLRPTPTEKPQSTPTPKPQKTPTPAPTATPVPTEAPTPTPQVNNTEGMDTDFIASLGTPQSGELLTAAGAVDTVFYLQTDPRWGSLIYGGEDTIAKYACGPTSMAIVVSSLTDIGIDPVQMSGWAFNKGYWYPKSGSLHSVVNGTAKAFGLKSEGVGNDSDTPKKVKEALRNGDMVVALMGKGHFTKGGHFIVLRGITAEGKILVADCNSRANTMTEWDFETIQSEAKWASDGGPFWIIRNPN